MTEEFQTETDTPIEVATQPEKVDLNAATPEELRTLPGIGPQLAQRIVAYREEHGPFFLPQEITAVSGIGSPLYERLADRLATIIPTDFPATEPVAEEAAPPMEELSAEPGVEEAAPSLPLAPVVEEPSTEEMAPPAAESAAAPVEEEAAPSPPLEPAETEPESPAAVAEERASRPAQPETPVQIPSSLPPQSPRRAGGGLTWLWSALLGGFLGMIFALLVLSGINGTLDINRSMALNNVRNRVADLSARQDSLQREVSGLRQRLDTLESLTARMTQVEGQVESLSQSLTDLDKETEALRGEVEELSSGLTKVQAQVEKADNFFQELNALLGKFFGEPENTPAESPVPGE